MLMTSSVFKYNVLAFFMFFCLLDRSIYLFKDYFIPRKVQRTKNQFLSLLSSASLNTFSVVYGFDMVVFHNLQ